ncbi:MAG TPA: hypothetical protein VGK36_14125 [Candidatus Angelobacter sp.]|jgi:hypothetical protein
MALLTKPREISGTSKLNSWAIGWKCGTCGRLVTKIEDGWIEWLVSKSRKDNDLLKGLRLVHALAVSPRRTSRFGCRYDPQREFKKDQSLVEGLSLDRFVGPDGLMLLLSLVANGELPREDILDLIKRVQIPGYEQAMSVFQKGLPRDVFTPSIGKGYYLQSEIRTLLRLAMK